MRNRIPRAYMYIRQQPTELTPSLFIKHPYTYFKTFRITCQLPWDSLTTWYCRIEDSRLWTIIHFRKNFRWKILSFAEYLPLRCHTIYNYLVAGFKNSQPITVKMPTRKFREFHLMFRELSGKFRIFLESLPAFPRRFGIFPERSGVFVGS